MAARSKTEKQLLTVRETAEYLGISAGSIYNAISKKAKRRFPIEPKRIGGSVRFNIRDIKALID